MMGILDKFNSMVSRKFLMNSVLLILITASLMAQAPDSVYFLSGIIYNESFEPVPATHVINLNTRYGDVTDSLGIFHLPVHKEDTLLIRNIVYVDTLVPVARIQAERYIRLRRAYYPLEEARIYNWGSTYEDFREAVVGMPNQQTLGETMGLPRQDPDHIPFDMDESLLKSTGFLLTSPVSYLFYNLNKKAKSNRRIYWWEKNRKKHEAFDQIVGPENIAAITGLSGEALQAFQAFLYQRMDCDFNCTEYEVFAEIYGLWEAYQAMQE
jgi:hypothetical protein